MCSRALWGKRGKVEGNGSCSGADAVNGVQIRRPRRGRTRVPRPAPDSPEAFTRRVPFYSRKRLPPSRWSLKPVYSGPIRRNIQLLYGAAYWLYIGRPMRVFTPDVVFQFVHGSPLHGVNRGRDGSRISRFPLLFSIWM